MQQRPNILFGHGSLSVELPVGVRARVIEKPVMPFLPEPAGAARAAFETPVCCERLSALASKARTACVLICDATRPVPNGTILPLLVRTLLKSAVDVRNIVVLVATGMHRPNVGEELRQLVGDDWVLDTVRVENHVAQDEAAHREVGVTSRGTRVKLDCRFLEADLKIATGLVEPHFMAGYSGGRKVVVPGIASADTIGAFHSARFMEDPAARNCNLHENPLHRDQLEIVEMIGPVYAVNTCVDAGRRLAFINFGEILASHRVAVEFMRRFAEVPLDRQYRCAITSGAGWPLDLNYYQTVKGMIGTLGCLEKGGSLLIASACCEGFGSAEFREAQQLLTGKGIDGFLREVRSHCIAKPDEWQTVKLVEALRHCRVHLYTTGLEEVERRLTGVTCHRDWNRAVRAVLMETQASEVAVIPEGPYVIPHFTPISIP